MFLAALLVSLALHFMISDKPVGFSAGTWGGVILMGLGIALNLWSDILFKKDQTTVKPFDDPARLILTGPFVFTRNPMYLGMEMILLGVGVLLGSPAAFSGALLFFLVCQYHYIPGEEEILRRTFKEKYLAYQKRVRRWL